MDERDVFDILLVIAVGIGAYLQTFGFADPVATLDEIVALLSSLDVRIYLVLGGIMGIFFVAYLVVYLPQKDASRSIRQS